MKKTVLKSVSQYVCTHYRRYYWLLHKRKKQTQDRHVAREARGEDEREGADKAERGQLSEELYIYIYIYIYLYIYIYIYIYIYSVCVCVRRGSHLI